MGNVAAMAARATAEKMHIARESFAEVLLYFMEMPPEKIIDLSSIYHRFYRLSIINLSFFDNFSDNKHPIALIQKGNRMKFYLFSLLAFTPAIILSATVKSTPTHIIMKAISLFTSSASLK